MKQISTYQELFSIARDIDVISRSPALKHFHAKQINSFFNLNKQRLNAMNKKFGEWQKEHVVHDENGHPKLTEKEPGKVQDFIFLTEADKAEYEAKFLVYMNQSIELYS